MHSSLVGKSVPHWPAVVDEAWWSVGLTVVEIEYPSQRPFQLTWRFTMVKTSICRLLVDPTCVGKKATKCLSSSGVAGLICFYDCVIRQHVVSQGERLAPTLTHYKPFSILFGPSGTWRLNSTSKHTAGGKTSRFVSWADLLSPLY